MYKKIAVILLFIALVILATGLFLVNNKQSDEQQDLDEFVVEQDGYMNSPDIDDSFGINIDRDGVVRPERPVDIDDERAPRSKEVLEQIVEKEITAKAVAIRKESTGRNYTKDELNFITNPRLNIIDNFSKDGEFTKKEIDLLK